MASQSTIPRILPLLLSVSLLNTMNPAVADEGKTLIRPVSMAVGVADADWKKGFVPNPKGGIDGIDLSTGKKLWSAPDVQVPLLVVGNALICRTSDGGKNRFRVISLDQDTGKLHLRSDPASLPEWAAITPAPGLAIDFTTAVEGDRLLIVWEARSWYGGGAAPPQEVVQKAKSEGKGLISVNLKSGKIEYTADDKAMARVKPELPKELSSIDSAPYLDAGQTSTKPFAVGRHFAAFSQAEVGKPSPVTLRRWDLVSYQPNREVQLAGSLTYGIQLAADRTQAFIRISPSEDKWQVFDLGSAKSLATVVLPELAASPVLRDSTLFYSMADSSRPSRPGVVSRRTFRAAVATTGKTIWEYEVAGFRITGLPK